MRRKLGSAPCWLDRRHMRLRLALLVTLLLSVAPVVPCFAADRFALVIGNAKYPDADAPLKEPVNDARDVAELHALEQGAAGGVLRAVHEDEVGRAARLDEAAVQPAQPRGVAGGEA